MKSCSREKGWMGSAGPTSTKFSSMAVDSPGDPLSHSPSEGNSYKTARSKLKSCHFTRHLPPLAQVPPKTYLTPQVQEHGQWAPSLSSEATAQGPHWASPGPVPSPRGPPPKTPSSRRAARSPQPACASPRPQGALFKAKPHSIKLHPILPWPRPSPRRPAHERSPGSSPL